MLASNCWVSIFAFTSPQPTVLTLHADCLLLAPKPAHSSCLLPPECQKRQAHCETQWHSHIAARQYGTVAPAHVQRGHTSDLDNEKASGRLFEPRDHRISI